MSKLFSRAIAAAAVVAVIGLPQWATAAKISAAHEAAQIQAHPPQVQLAFKLACKVQGTPVEFPDDIALINNGPGTVAKGTKVHWKLASPAHEGDYTFAAALAPGKVVYLSGVLPGGVEAGKPCTVTLK